MTPENSASNTKAHGGLNADPVKTLVDQQVLPAEQAYVRARRHREQALKYARLKEQGELPPFLSAMSVCPSASIKTNKRLEDLLQAAWTTAHKTFLNQLFADLIRVKELEYGEYFTAYETRIDTFTAKLHDLETQLRPKYIEPLPTPAQLNDILQGVLPNNDSALNNAMNENTEPTVDLWQQTWDARATEAITQFRTTVDARINAWHDKLHEQDLMRAQRQLEVQAARQDLNAEMILDDANPGARAASLKRIVDELVTKRLKAERNKTTNTSFPLNGKGHGAPQVRKHPNQGKAEKRSTSPNQQPPNQGAAAETGALPKKPGQKDKGKRASDVSSNKRDELREPKKKKGN